MDVCRRDRRTGRGYEIVETGYHNTANQQKENQKKNVACIDHFVITTAGPQAISGFYQKLGFTATAKAGEIELAIGDFKIHVQTLGQELIPHARNVQPGSVDICFQSEAPIREIRQALQTAGLVIESGPVQRVGAKGDMTSVYLRDPDGNLVELSSYREQ